MRHIQLNMLFVAQKRKERDFIICGLREREREREKKKKDFDQDFDQCHLSVLVRRVYVITTRSF